MEDKAIELLMGKICGIDIEKERRKKKMLGLVCNTAVFLALVSLFFWGMKGCLDDSYHDNHPVPALAAAQPKTGDPEYFSWMMRNDAEFRKQVEEADRLERKEMKKFK